jgi:hypothetical protein
VCKGYDQPALHDPGPGRLEGKDLSCFVLCHTYRTVHACPGFLELQSVAFLPVWMGGAGQTHVGRRSQDLCTPHAGDFRTWQALYNEQVQFTIG